MHDKRGLRILVVDDNHDAAIMLSALLELVGHRTSTAHNGLDAVEAATRVRYDAVLLDLGMPIMDGFQAAAVLGQLRPAPLLIACSAWYDAETRRRTANLGFSAHLCKPVPLEALEAALRQVRPAVPNETNSGWPRGCDGEMQDVAHPHELGQGLRSHLAHDLSTVDLDGHLAHAELAGDLLVHAPEDHQRHDLAFARREGGKALPQVLQDGGLPALRTVALDAGVDRIEQLLVAKRLGEELDGPGLDRAH